MSNENPVPRCKQRFKGIENFLRRVAFNLGNTPSQTEVKIISCIPIDVTDLQQKINSLEKELIEARAGNNNKNVTANVNIPKNTPNLGIFSPIIQTALGKPVANFCKPKSLTQSKCSQSKASVTNHGSNTKPEKPCKGCHKRRKTSSVCIVSAFSSDDKGNGVCKIKSKIDTGFKRESSPTTTKVGHKIIPKKLRKALNKSRLKRTQLVYFTHASAAPFHSHENNVLENKINKNIISQDYINRIIRKQYKPELIINEVTDVSQLSAPACRDNSNNGYYESTIPYSYNNLCNLDAKNPNRIQYFNASGNNGLAIDQGKVTRKYLQNHVTNYNEYYDSDDYDIYPVKEKPCKHKDSLSKALARPLNEIFSNNNIINNFCSIPIDTNKTFNRNNENKVKSYNIYDNIVSEKRHRTKKHDVNLKLCSIDFGDVYLKRNRAIEMMEKYKRTKPLFRNVECLTVNTNNMESQTVESKAVQFDIAEENNAEFVLNQIKTILQSVLTEVKTNVKSSSKCQQKKDVLIQKDISYTGGSSLLNTFTYNPSYSINPYLASCSRHVPNYCYANFAALPVKYFRDCPLLVPQIRHLDCNCLQKSMITNNNSFNENDTKQSTTAGTNTDKEPCMKQKSETGDLMNEIYTSTASYSNYCNKTASRMSVVNQKNHREAREKNIPSRNKKMTQQLFIGDDHNYSERVIANLSTSREFPSETRSEQNIVYTKKSHAPSRDGLKISDFSGRELNSDENLNCSLRMNNVSIESVEDEKQSIENEINYTDESKDAYNKVQASSNESNSERTLVAGAVPKQSKGHPSLLQKVFRTVRNFKGKRVHYQQSGDENENDSEGTGTENQTVYSYKTYGDLKSATRKDCQTKILLHHEKQTNKSLQEQQKRLSPYMEQEYRRYWDEKLMFHEEKPPRSSEKSYLRWTKSPESPVFRKGYKVRSAILKAPLVGSPEIKRNTNNTSQVKTGLKLQWIKKQKFKAPMKKYK